MASLTRISAKTPKTKRPVTKYEYTLRCSVRKTPYVLRKTKKFTIGRMTKNDITLPQGTTSDIHASIKWSKSAFRLTDENSTNGTYLNGKRISDAASLTSGDKIKIGKYVIIFKAKKIRIKTTD
ncbi:MAG: FHA domain-containing protein [Spirochaetales bacterium]|nr:FHA domain-containing protein [Spirochaetales bacterium]